MGSNRSILLFTAALGMIAATGCSIQGTTYWLFKPLWHRNPDRMVALTVSCPASAETSSHGASKYLNQMQSGDAGSLLEAEIREKIKNNEKAQASYNSPHNIEVKSIRISETSNEVECEGNYYYPSKVQVSVSCTFLGPRMKEHVTVSVYDSERVARRTKKNGTVVCSIKGRNISLERLLKRAADKTVSRYMTTWRKHLRKEARQQRKESRGE